MNELEKKMREQSRRIVKIEKMLSSFVVPSRFVSNRDVSLLAQSYQPLKGYPIHDTMVHRIYVSHASEDAKTFVFNLPQHTEFFTVDETEREGWRSRSETRDVIAKFSERTNRFSIPETSALLKLAAQYEIAPPRNLERIRRRAMKRFMFELQYAMYRDVAPALTYANRTGEDGTDLGMFFVESLLVQARGGELSDNRFLQLHAEYISRRRLDDKWVYYFPADERRANIALNNPDLLRDENFADYMDMPMSLLEEVYLQKA
jgi:hypothetical protein